MNIDDFSINIPEELIAKFPLEPRDSSKLLYRNDSKILEGLMSSFVNLLRDGDILVFNDTKVFPSRFNVFINNKKAEITLHKQLSEKRWLAFVKPAKIFIVGSYINISDNINAKILAKHFGEVELEFNIDSANLLDHLDTNGLLPLPPYLKRQQNNSDIKNYQTIYSRSRGAVAAPTAGLHFTESLFESIKNKGINKAFLTLHVGAGTFLPVKVNNINDHKMHSEYGLINDDVVKKINETKKNGGRVIAIGTTSLRLLESAAGYNGLLNKYNGETDIFIKPGYDFKIVDCLLTNFHLSKSTLLMLVSAFCGIDEIRRIYNYAIDNKFRFFSYGDACFLERKVKSNSKNP